MAKGIKDIDAHAQKLMKQHKKKEVFKVGEKHLYFNKKSALVTAGGDEEKVKTITLEKTPVKEQPKEKDGLEDSAANDETPAVNEDEGAAIEDTSTPLSVSNGKEETPAEEEPETVEEGKKEDKPKNAKK